MSTASTPARLHLADESQTARLGALLADALLAERSGIERDGFTWTLSGELGSGKTALVRACLRRLGVTGPVKSPTFALLEPYVVSSLNFHHLDFYRFKDPQEFTEGGFRELFGPGNVCAIEWPERASGHLPTADLEASLNVEDEGRQVALFARSELGAACLQRVLARWAVEAGNAGA